MATYASSAPEQTGIWSWITTVDHKRIGTMYLFTALFFFLFGFFTAEAAAE